MAADTYTEVTRRSWGSKLGGSIKGIFGGLVIAAIGVVLLWWNEGQAVTTARSLKEGARDVVSVLAERVDAGNEGKPIHTSGEATTSETLVDPVCGVQVQAIALRRKVEMYQWQESSRSETRKKLGGGEETVTTYTYERAGRQANRLQRLQKAGRAHQPGIVPARQRDLAGRHGDARRVHALTWVGEPDRHLRPATST